MPDPFFCPNPTCVGRTYSVALHEYDALRPESLPDDVPVIACWSCRRVYRWSRESDDWVYDDGLSPREAR